MTRRLTPHEKAKRQAERDAYQEAAERQWLAATLARAPKLTPLQFVQLRGILLAASPVCPVREV